MTIINIICAWFTAELIAGIVHWWEDRYGNPEWPVLGKYVVTPNIVHHTDQMKFTNGNYLQRNWTTLLPSLTIMTVFLVLNYWWLALVFLFVSQANEIHCWSHMKCSRPIRGLQLLGLLQSPDQHQKHHKQPFNTSFCVMTDFMNPVLNAINFWGVLERLIAVFGIRPRPERSAA